MSSQESRRKDLGGGGGGVSKSAPSSSSVKIPAAHSTSPGLAPAAVSTTTSIARRTKHLGECVYHRETLVEMQMDLHNYYGINSRLMVKIYFANDIITKY